jgi:hypothetical protein
MIGVREVASSNLTVPTISMNHLRLPALAAVLLLWQTSSRKIQALVSIATRLACVYRRVVWTRAAGACVVTSGPAMRS